MRYIISLVALLATGCVNGLAGTAPSPPRRTTVQVQGVRLEYLDYGGSGPGLVFLPGLGDSPHAYDEIAPHFTHRFHVVSYARRGHGGSEARGPWDVPTLAEDLRELLDSLHMPRAILAGWSMGGAEITALAERHPERVAGVVFLDTYDLSGPEYRAMLAAYPVSYAPDPRDRASVDAFTRWWKESAAPDVAWTPAMKAELADLYRVEPDGSVQLHVTDSLEAAFLGALLAYQPKYQLIRAPVLAFWAEPYPDGLVPASAPDTIQAKAREWFKHRLMPWQDSVHARFARALPNARIVVLEHTRHSALPFQRRDRIVAEMTRFLEGIRVSPPGPPNKA